MQLWTAGEVPPPLTIVLAVTTGKSDAAAPPKAATVTFGSRGLAIGGTF